MDINPLGEIISDEQYDELMAGGYLNSIKIRDKTIKNRYNELRKLPEKLSSFDCIDKIQREEYKYLTFESIRKIVMTNGKRATEKH